MTTRLPTSSYWSFIETRDDVTATLFVKSTPIGSATLTVGCCWPIERPLTTRAREHRCALTPAERSVIDALGGIMDADVLVRCLSSALKAPAHVRFGSPMPVLPGSWEANGEPTNLAAYPALGLMEDAEVGSMLPVLALHASGRRVLVTPIVPMSNTDGFEDIGAVIYSTDRAAVRMGEDDIIAELVAEGQEDLQDREELRLDIDENLEELYEEAPSAVHDHFFLAGLLDRLAAETDDAEVWELARRTRRMLEEYKGFAVTFDDAAAFQTLLRRVAPSIELLVEQLVRPGQRGHVDPASLKSAIETVAVPLYAITAMKLGEGDDEPSPSREELVTMLTAALVGEAGLTERSDSQVCLSGASRLVALAAFIVQQELPPEVPDLASWLGAAAVFDVGDQSIMKH